MKKTITVLVESETKEIMKSKKQSDGVPYGKQIDIAIKKVAVEGLI